MGRIGKDRNQEEQPQPEGEASDDGSTSGDIATAEAWAGGDEGIASRADLERIL